MTGCDQGLSDPKRGSELQNRVDPSGQLHVRSERGAWLGNRGILHDEHKVIVKQWQHNGWVTCLLNCGESTRTGATSRDKLFTKGNYSELFFLDEGTAFSAGHRPCAQCRNKRYREFKSAWAAANLHLLTSADPPYQEMDKILQDDRVGPDGKKKYDEILALLPAGTMIELGGVTCLIWRCRLYRWSFSGYSPYEKKVAPTTSVKVLTPASIVRTYTTGFVPQVHVSAFF